MNKGADQRVSPGIEKERAMNRNNQTAATNRILTTLAMAALWLAGASGGWAAEARTWTGAVSANWADAQNWSGGAAPGAADDVVIEGGKFQPVLDLTNGAVTIKSLTLGGKTTAATLTFTNGNVTDKILIVKGDVTVGTNGVLTHASETAKGKSVGDETQRLGLVIGGNLTIGAGGAIRVAGCGYAMGAGPYKAVGTSGGVHGGEGGFGRDSSPPTTPTYGSVTSPVTAGGGSGYGAAGGGVAVIRAVGRLTVDGVIDASGGQSQAGQGAGAGGSVNIRAGELLGKGSVSAKGGDADAAGGGAGGGRIAVVLTKAATFGSVTMNAAGGAVVWKALGYGAAGTIYLQGAGQAAGMLIVSNPPLAGVGGARTLIGPEVTGDIPADVRVLDRARYVVTRDTVTVLDKDSLWRHFQVQRCAYVRTDDGKLEPWDLQPLTLTPGGWPPGMIPKPATSTAPSTLPPVGWAGLAMDDSTWPRVRLPIQIAHEVIANGSGIRPQNRDGATAALLVRGRFEVKNPAAVKSCRLSVDYVGGVVVTVNGKEVLRRHVPGDKPDLLALAEDYPKEVFASDACDRYAREISIPVALLRTGVNVLAIEVHAAPYTQGYVKSAHGRTCGRCWDPIGLISAQMSISPVAAAVANVARPAGIRLWNCAPYDTVSVFDYGDPCESLRPVTIHAARNSVFSGRLMVSSDQTIKGLKATVSDLTQLQEGRTDAPTAREDARPPAQKRTDGLHVEGERPREPGGPSLVASLPASAIQVRYAVPVVTGAPPANAYDSFKMSGGKSSVAPHRFDGLLDAIPAEIPVSQAPAPMENFRGRLERKALIPGAVAPLWFTVRVPRDAKPGVYEGRVTISAQGLPATNVPLRVSVGDWTLPDPKDFRMHNLAYNEPEVVAGLNGVPLWSDRHFELQGRSQALMAEAGSRQFFANLCPAASPGNAEGLVRWIKQPDGSFKHDFSAFDKYLDMVAESVGKPFPLLLNCWRGLEPSEKNRWVSLLDPATGKISRMKQPADSEEALALWKPVFDEVLKKIKARGWLDVTALGWISTHGGPSGDVPALARQLWPDAVWGIMSHSVNRDYKDGANPWVKVRYARTVYSYGFPSVRGYRELLQPQSVFLCNTYRWSWNDSTPLNDQRRVGEDIIMSGRDGISEFGVNGGGCGWPAGPEVSQMAILYPGPDGPVATERFEMFREGVELAEALIFIERAIQEKKLSPELQQKAEKALEARSEAFIKDWFTIRNMPGAEEDAKLLGLAGEVAREMGKK